MMNGAFQLGIFMVEDFKFQVLTEIGAFKNVLYSGYSTIL